MIFKFAILSFALFLFLFLFVSATVVLQVSIGNEVKIMLELIIGRRWFKREFMGERFKIYNGNVFSLQKINWFLQRLASGHKDFQIITSTLRKNIYIRRILRKCCSRFKLQIDWSTVVGLENTMETAVISGLVWGIKGMITGILTSYFQVTEAKINVSPFYYHKMFMSSVRLTVRSMVINYIIVSISIAVVYLIQHWTRPKRINEYSPA